MQRYKLGSLYALVTAVLYATQEPFSFLAAKSQNTIQFVFLTQAALLMSVPLLLLRAASRRDLIKILGDGSNYSKLGLILTVTAIGLVLYNLGLAGSHPVIISAILNLTPFWAALAALIVSRVPIPVSPLIFLRLWRAHFLAR